MSQEDEDLELQVVQRVLDDAFATTRPRPGFDDELWARMQARRPFGTRVRDALAGLVQGVRAVPAVPASAVAVVLVVALGVGLIALGARGHGTAGSAGSALAPEQLSQQGGGRQTQQYGPNSTTAFGEFGRLPSPQFTTAANPPPGDHGPAPAAAGATPTPYFGPATLVWAGRLDLSITSAPVYRYHEPTTNAADQFASSLGATLVDRPSGFLGSYDSADYTLKVRGTVQSPPQGPSFFILSSPAMPPVATAGSSPVDVAVIFLANRSLVPQWTYTSDVVATPGGLTRVRLLRQFDVSGYGPAGLVDAGGNRYGIEVDLDGTRAELVSGPLPITMDVAAYPIVTASVAVGQAAAAQGFVPPGAPTVQLTHAELVYVLAPAGDHSFYEPAFLFSGTFQQGGVTYEKRLLVPAVDPSQRS